MLPNKMKISDKAFNSLRRLQNNVGLTVNIGARLAFFTSIERGHRYQGEAIELNQRELDKHTWLGEHSKLVEMLLKERYPTLNKQGMHRAWGSHIEDGARLIASTPSIFSLVTNIK